MQMEMNIGKIEKHLTLSRILGNQRFMKVQCDLQTRKKNTTMSKHYKIKLLVLILNLIIITACSDTKKNCQLIGKWKSTSFISNKTIDKNKDGIYNTDILKEDECSEVVFHFLKNGKAERISKNKRTNCINKRSSMNYVIDENQLLFIVSGMEQKHTYEIVDCKLHIYNIQDRGLTESGKQNILITSVFEKQ